jgi:hypothetical protein
MGVMLLTLVGLWAALPWIASIGLEQWLKRQGYENVSVKIGRPGLRSTTLASLVLTQRMTGEIVTLSLGNAQAEYTLLGLLSGRMDLLTLRQLSIEITTSPAGLQNEERAQDVSAPDAPESLLNAFTASDIVQRLPFVPCDEVHLEEAKLFREQATGPLRTVVMKGTIKRQGDALVAEMLLQGIDTIPYELRVTVKSAADMSLQLRAAQPDAVPFVLWRSESAHKEARVHLEGVLEINVQEFAPFVALVVPIGPEWQRVRGNVTIHWAGTAASDVPVSSLWNDAGTEVSATVQIAATLPELKGYGKDIAVKATGTLSGNVRLVHWTLGPGALVTATVNPGTVGRMPPLASLFRYGSQPVSLDSAQESTGELFWTESPPRYTASGPLIITYGYPKGPLYAELALRQLLGQGRVLERADVNVLVKGSLPPAVSERLKVKQASAEVRGVLTWMGTALRGTVSPSSTVTIAQFKHEPLQITAVFQLDEPLPIDADMATGRWAAGPASLTWRTPRIEMAGSHATIERTVMALDRIEGSARGLNARLTTTLDGLRLNHASGRSRPIDLTVRIQVDPLSLKADIQTGSQEQALKLAAQLEHEWATGRGAVHGLLGPVTFDRATFRLRQLWFPWPYPVDVTEGSVAGIFDFRWAADTQHQPRMQGGSADITLERLAGHYRDIALTGVNAKMKMAANEGLERIAISKPAEVAIASIHTGVEVTDLAMTIEGEWDLRERLPLVEVRNIRCELLGGTATSQGMRADLAYPPYALTVLVRQLDLHEIFNLEQQKGLQGSGVLDGSIPITVTPRGVIVKDGNFEARPPGGFIRYTASPDATQAVTQANANMHVVLQALNNFHYSVLQVGARYVEDGTLQLKARLEGKNPDQKSPPIHFNLTVQENIPALLKSLRLVQDLENSVKHTFVEP